MTQTIARPMVGEKLGRVARLRKRIGGVLLTLAFLVGVPVAAASATPPPLDPGAIAGDLVNTGGPQMLGAIVDVLPILIPFLVALWAVGFAWKKIRPKSGGLS